MFSSFQNTELWAESRNPVILNDYFPKQYLCNADAACLVWAMNLFFKYMYKADYDTAIWNLKEHYKHLQLHFLNVT
jgi:hypothetical protein